MQNQEEVGAKEVVGFFLQWLRANNLSDTERILTEEITNASPDALDSAILKVASTEAVDKNLKPDASKNEKVEEATENGSEEPKELPQPVGSGEVPANEKKREPADDEPEPAPESEVVDVVNFEASLAEQLKQLVNDLSVQGRNPNSDSAESPDDDVDEWTDPDELGYVRVQGRPSDEHYEICDDDEHRRGVAQYIEDIDAQEQAYKAYVAQQKAEENAKPSTSETLVAQDVEDSQTAGGSNTQAPAPSVPPPPNASKEGGKESEESEEQPTQPQDTKQPVTKHKYGQAAQENSKQNQAPPVMPPTYPNTYHTTGKKITPPQNRKHPVYEAFDLKVIFQVHRTGFEEQKDYPIRMYDIIAGRYQILEYLGSAAFSRAVQCVDLKTGQLVCVKIIRNNKDFFDQGLDEIKLLHYLNANGDPDENCVLQLYDYFYHKEHLFLVCELLRDNLYEFSKYNRESGDELYFNLPRLQKITRQVLTALRFIHNLHLIHCDLKPENILIKSYSRCEVKVIDFGSSCFTTDHLSSYVQSRCYRAPEVILGLPYNQKIDMWSLGAILAELYSGRVLFHNDSISTMMARIVAICGPFPDYMLKRARYSNRFFTRHGALFERNKQTGQISYLYPKRTKLRHRIGTDDPLFVDFVQQILHLDPHKRPTAEEALQHPFLFHNYGPINPN